MRVKIFALAFILNCNLAHAAVGFGESVYNEFISQADILSACGVDRGLYYIRSEEFLSKVLNSQYNQIEKIKRSNDIKFNQNVSSFYKKFGEFRKFYDDDKIAANKIFSSITVDELSSVLKQEDKRRIRATEVACRLVSVPEFKKILQTMNTRVFLSSLPVQRESFADTVAPDGLRQSDLCTAEFKNHYVSMFPNAAFFENDDRFEDIFAAVLAHELIHTIQAKYYPDIFCAKDASGISNSILSGVDRSYLYGMSNSLKEDLKAEFSKREKKLKKLVGLGVGGATTIGSSYILKKSRVPKALILGATAGSVAYRLTHKHKADLDIPFSELEADSDGAWLACRAGYNIDTFRLMMSELGKVKNGRHYDVGNESTYNEELSLTADFIQELKSCGSDGDCGGRVGTYHHPYAVRWKNLVSKNIASSACTHVRNEVPTSVVWGKEKLKKNGIANGDGIKNTRSSIPNKKASLVGNDANDGSNNTDSSSTISSDGPLTKEQEVIAPVLIDVLKACKDSDLCKTKLIDYYRPQEDSLLASIVSSQAVDVANQVNASVSNAKLNDDPKSSKVGVCNFSAMVGNWVSEITGSDLKVFGKEFLFNIQQVKEGAILGISSEVLNDTYKWGKLDFYTKSDTLAIDYRFKGKLEKEFLGFCSSDGNKITGLWKAITGETGSFVFTRN